MKYLLSFIFLFALSLSVSGQSYYNNMAFSTYFGGEKDDLIQDVAVDSAGYIYIVGHTSSQQAGYPNPMQSTYHGGISDVFLARLSPDAHEVLAYAYFGGEGRDEARSIAVRPDQKIVISGVTDSKNLPLTSVAFKSSKGKSTEGFLALFDNGLTELFSSSYTGKVFGSFDMEYLPIWVEDDNDIVLAQSSPADPGFEIQSVDSANSLSNVLILRVNEYLSIVKKATFFGGPGYDEVSDIKWLADENAFYFCGWTSTDTLFYTEGVWQNRNNGSYDAFLAKMTGDFTIDRCSFFGGRKFDKAVKIVDQGNAALTLAGISYSDTFVSGLPGLRDTLGLNVSDIFLANFNSDLTEVSAFTYYGGENIEYLTDAFLDAKGSIYLTGSTLSNQFPVTWYAFDKDFGSPIEGYAVQLSPNLEEVHSATFIGDSLSDAVNAGALLPSGAIVQVGYTLSPRFMLTPEAFDTILQGGSDGFVLVSNVFSVGIEPITNELPWRMKIVGHSVEMEVPEGYWHMAIYDLSGRKQYSSSMGFLAKGLYRKSLPGDLKGFYLIEIYNKDVRMVAKAFFAE